MDLHSFEDLSGAIKQWLSLPANNAIEPGSSQPAFGKPLIGCAAGDDALFPFLENDIGPEKYWTPLTAFKLAYPGENLAARDLRVIAWILPQTRETRIAQRKARTLPSVEWSKARHYGEKVNENLRTYVTTILRAQGSPAFAPTLLREWQRFNSEKYGFSSSWSERHAAYCCGLGTFGISDGLITAAGKAVRVGSVIVRSTIFEPTPRKYSSHKEWCLLSVGKCLVCGKRCPTGAISRDGHDKTRCKAYIREVTSVHVKNSQLGFPVNSCGLCQTNVPCEFRNPLAVKVSDS